MLRSWPGLRQAEASWAPPAPKGPKRPRQERSFLAMFLGLGAGFLHGFHGVRFISLGIKSVGFWGRGLLFRTWRVGDQFAAAAIDLAESLRVNWPWQDPVIPLRQTPPSRKKYTNHASIMY